MKSIETSTVWLSWILLNLEVQILDVIESNIYSISSE